MAGLPTDVGNWDLGIRGLRASVQNRCSEGLLETVHVPAHDVAAVGALGETLHVGPPTTDRRIRHGVLVGQGHVPRSFLDASGQPYRGWTKSSSHHLRHPGADDSFVNTNKEWFLMLSKWCRISSIHSKWPGKRLPQSQRVPRTLQGRVSENAT